MRIIGVIDLAGGCAVHGQGGHRRSYQPVRTVGGLAIESGDAPGLAHAYVQRLGIRELYVADLDALAGDPMQSTLIGAIASAGAPLLVDAGVTSVADARRVRSLTVDRVVVALETLTGYQALQDICDSLGGSHVAFSLDLRRGQPMIASANRHLSADPAEAMAARATEAGARTVMVIDVARVGMGAGLDFELLARVRRAVPGIALLAGGGVRGVDDVARLAGIGVDGVLIATALHDGRIGAAAIAEAERQQSVSR